MAVNDGYRWPGPVTFNDDDPKKGYFTLFLTLKEMNVKRLVLKKNISTNTVFNDNDMFENETICVIGKVQMDGGEMIEYQYKKGLPEDIVAEKCSYKLKNDQIILNLCKREVVSWAQHAKYLIKRE